MLISPSLIHSRRHLSLLASIMCLYSSAVYAGVCPPFDTLCLPAAGAEGTTVRIGVEITEGGRRMFLEDEVDVTWLHVPSMTLSFDMAKDIRLIFDHPMLMIMDDDEGREKGTGDLSIIGLYKLLDETVHHPSVVLQLGVKLPNADYQKELGTDETDFFIGAVFTDQIGSSMLVINTAFGIIGNPYTLEPTQDDVLIYGVGLHHHLTRRISVGCEVEGVYNSRFQNDQSVARLGVAFSTKRAIIDASVGAGLNDESPDYFASFGVTIDISLGEPDGPGVRVDPDLPAVELPANPEDAEYMDE